MDKPQKNEQWLLDGDCEKCRRKNYCKKTCTRRERALKAQADRAVFNMLNKVTGGVFGEMVERVHDATHAARERGKK